MPRFIACASLSLAVLTLIAGCAPTFPLVAVGVPGDQGFKVRIAKTYPPGSDPAPLRAELASEGFELLADSARRGYSAVLRGANIPCLSYVRVDWTEDRRGRIAAIQAERLDCS